MNKNNHSPIRGYVIILTSAILFGTYGVWSRLMGKTFPPFFQAWVRSLLIVLLMLPFMLIGRSFRRIERRHWPALGVYIAFCVCTQVPVYYAFNHVPIGTAQLIFYSMFVIAAYVVGRFYLDETITRVKLVSIALAFVGLGIVFGVSVVTYAPLALGLAALNGVASGGEVSTSKKISDSYPAAILTLWGWVFTFATHLPLSLMTHEAWPAPRLDAAWLWLLMYSIVNALAFWLVIAGFRHVDASIGSLIGLSEVVFAIIFGAIIFHQSLGESVWLGGLLIVVAAILPDGLALWRRRAANAR